MLIPKDLNNEIDKHITAQDIEEMEAMTEDEKLQWECDRMNRNLEPVYKRDWVCPKCHNSAVYFTTDLPRKIIWSSVIGRVVTLPATTLYAESPTRITSTPASSTIEAIVKSYDVIILIFSPRCFISNRRCVVTLRTSSGV